MTKRDLYVRIPFDLHRQLATLSAEGILGRTVVIHLTRNALHRDWIERPQTAARPSSQPVPTPRPGKSEAIEAGFPATKRLLRLPEVCSRVGLARSSIYQLVHLGRFPAPRKLGARSVAWLQIEVDTWIESRAHAG
ncbi:MAG: AlpA family transcriptional regulator [Rhizobium sp.]|nr:AlpA family transcriptional regulator [Rhizobium sp.]